MSSGCRKRGVNAPDSGAIHKSYSLIAKAPIAELLLFMSATSSAVLYIDESGDLGWTFSAPHGAGGSSRYLTIATICVSSDKKHIPKRVIKNLYNKFNWPTNIEKKWSAMAPEERCEFADAAHSMCAKHPDIHLHAIAVQKEKRTSTHPN